MIQSQNAPAAVGAPVEVRGIKIGEVAHIKAQFDQETLTPRILVFIQTNPNAFDVVGEATLSEKDEMERMIDKGMRAQLQTGSLLTAFNSPHLELISVVSSPSLPVTPVLEIK